MKYRLNFQMGDEQSKELGGESDQKNDNESKEDLWIYQNSKYTIEEMKQW